MAAVAAGAAIVGAGVSIYGAIKSGEDQARIDSIRQSMANKQADETEYRENINEALRNEEASKAQLDFGAQYAASGKEGTGLGSQLEIARQNAIRNAVSKREADFQAAMLRQGGSLQGELGQMSQNAGYISALGSGLSLAGRFASNPATSPNTERPQSLPQANEPTPRFSGGN